MEKKPWVKPEAEEVTKEVMEQKLEENGLPKDSLESSNAKIEIEDRISLDQGVILAEDTVRDMYPNTLIDNDFNKVYAIFKPETGKLIFNEEEITDNGIINGKTIVEKVLNASALVEYEVGNMSDGYHTFNELYDHRITLYLALLSYMKDDNKYFCWWSEKHHDDDGYPGWIIVGVTKRGAEGYKQISYHIPDSYIKTLRTMGITELERAKEWDGHTPKDVITRLTSWLIMGEQND